MVWLDDSLFRGSSGDRGRIPLRTSDSHAPGASPPYLPSPGIESDLTEPQQSANKSLLEGYVDHQGEIQLLLADIRSLEKAVREQNNQRIDLEAKLEQQFRQQADDVAALKNDHARDVAAFHQRLDQRRRESESLLAELVQTSDSLDRKVGELERVRLENERLQEIVDSQFVSFQLRIDELVVALESEQAKSTRAEQETRRLSVSRSERINFLAGQRDLLLAERNQLHAKDHQLAGQLAMNAAVTRAAKRLLLDATGGLIQQANEIKQLRRQSAAYKVAASSSHQESSGERFATQGEVDRLTADASQMNHPQQQPTQITSPSVSDPDLQFAITQRDRTIAMLEQKAAKLQQRLQREAAARRKAEGVIKREAHAAGLDTAVHDAWAQIDAQDQLERMKKHVQALHNVNLLQRQRSVADILRYKTGLERLPSNDSKRAA